MENTKKPTQSSSDMAAVPETVGGGNKNTCEHAPGRSGQDQVPPGKERVVLHPEVHGVLNLVP